MKRVIAALSSLSLLSGCYSLQGSERLLDRDGYVTDVVPEKAIFRADFLRAFEERQAGRQPTDDEIDAMLRSGFSHIYSYCDNYFDVMGMQQRKARIARDAIAPIASVITGILALHNFENNSGRKEDMLAVLGLTTAASSASLDIYSEHMLFGAENIGSVETLTKAALVKHSSTVLAFEDIDFSAAVRHLLDNQAICSPQHILLLTREAIREGQVEARIVQPNAGLVTTGSDGDQRVNVVIENTPQVREATQEREEAIEEPDDPE